MTARARNPRQSGADESVDDALAPWLVRHAVTMLAAVALLILEPNGVWVALAGAWSFADLWVRVRKVGALGSVGRLANGLTAVRLCFVLVSCGFAETLPVVWVWLLLAANVAIDVGDGYVARRRGEATPFGAVFDREVDAVFVLVAYQYLFLVAGLPAWVLIPGALPYVFRLATTALHDAPAPEHRERIAPILAGANFVVLLIAIATPPRLMVYAVAVSMALVAASFLVSFAKLLSREYSVP